MKLSLDTPSDQVILRALREGRMRQAADALVLIYGGAVYRACRLACADADTAEDLAYGTFAATFADPRKLSGSAGIKTSLLHEARARVMAALLPDVPVDEGEAPTLDAEGASVERDTLRRAIEGLAARPRALVGVAYGFGLSGFPLSSEQHKEELLATLRALVAAVEQEHAPSVEAVVLRLADLRWRSPERLQRRLEVLCSSVGG